MDDLDPMAERFAAEHKRFLEEHNPSVLRGQSDRPAISSVGETAAEMFWHLMRECMYRVRDLPHKENGEGVRMPPPRGGGIDPARLDLPTPPGKLHPAVRRLVRR